MIASEYGCNVCLETMAADIDLIGLEFKDDCRWVRVPLEKTLVHICKACLGELHTFWTAEAAKP